MKPRTPRSTRTDTLVPYTTLFRARATIPEDSWVTPQSCFAGRLAMQAVRRKAGHQRNDDQGQNREHAGEEEPVEPVAAHRKVQVALCHQRQDETDEHRCPRPARLLHDPANDELGRAAWRERGGKEG